MTIGAIVMYGVVLHVDDVVMFIDLIVANANFEVSPHILLGSLS